MKQLLYFYLFLMPFTCISIQANSTIDSLQNLLQSESDLEQQAILLIQLGSAQSKQEKYIEAILSFDQAIEKANPKKHLPIIANAIQKKGNAYLYQGKLDSAKLYFEKCIALPDEPELLIYKSYSFANIGWILSEKGDNKEALVFYQSALTIDREQNDSLGISADLKNIGTSHFYLGNYTKSIDAFIESKHIAEKLHNKQEVADLLNNIGNVYRILEEPDHAIGIYKQSISIDSTLGNLESIATTNANISDIYTDIKDYKLAEKYILKAEEFYKQDEKFEYKLARTYSRRANISRYKDEYQQALGFLLKAQPIYGKSENQQAIAENLIGFGKVYNQLKQYSKSILYLNRAEELSNKIEVLIEQKNCYHELSIAYAGLGQYLKAYNYQIRYDELNTKILTELNTNVKANLADLRTSEKEKENQLLKQETEIKDLALKEQGQSNFIQRIISGVSILGLLLLSLVLCLVQKSRKVKELFLSERMEILENSEQDLLVKNNSLEQSQSLLKEDGEKLTNEYELIYEQQEVLQKKNKSLSKAYEEAIDEKRRLSNQIENQNKNQLRLNLETQMFKLQNNSVVALGEIIYIQADANYVLFKLISGEVIRNRNTISNLMKELPNELFAKTHRSFIANIRQIKFINSHQLLMNNGEHINLSESGKKLINNLL